MTERGLSLSRRILPTGRPGPLMVLAILTSCSTSLMRTLILYMQNPCTVLCSQRNAESFRKH